MRKTKIICTLGPSTDKDGVLEELVKEGMNVARFNFSHGLHDEQKGRIDKLKEIRTRLNKPVAALLDTKGPEIRIREFENGKVTLKEGQEFTLTTEEIVGNEKIVSVTYKDLYKDVKPGNSILIDDGLIGLEVKKIKGQDIICKVVNGGVLGNKKGVNLPGVEVNMPFISPKDHDDILFGIKEGYDFIAASFTRTAADVKEIRDILEKNGGQDIKELAADMGMTFDDLKNVVASLHEFNPMMGHRGCRLAVTYPEIAAMQTRAVIKAALNVSAETGYMITPHIMIPLVGEVKELKFVKDVVVKVADELIAAAGVDMKYLVGTMIEIPRAALTAGEIAKEAEFFSFGTNDLTQMTFGFSRDDAAKFLGAYYENKIYESDPFQHLDQVGVGKLVKMAAHDGRETRPDLGLGICGEHGGDPTSVEFCHNVGLDYVSCSPFRVPIARLAAAQAAIKNPRK